MSARPLLTGVVVIVAFAVGLFVARAFWRTPEPPPLERATLYPAPRPIPELELVDQDGRPLDRSGLAGRWTLIFFGFTNCPDVCPTTLATLKRARDELADLSPDLRPDVLLISVDPERDTPDRLGAYVRFFDTSFRGATGSPDAIGAFTRAFAVPYAKVALDGDSYTVDHGSAVFVLDPGAAIVAHSSAPHDARVLAADDRRIIDFVGRRDD
jgi:protein SCO1/2